MTKNEFKGCKKYLHIADNGFDPEDWFAKVYPVLIETAVNL